MYDLEKVIKGLECCSAMNGEQCGGCPYAAECEEGMIGAVWAGLAHLCADALALLKAQEAVKPFVTGNGRTFEEVETWWYECGNCNKPINPNDRYCRHCGKAVKWDAE